MAGSSSWAGSGPQARARAGRGRGAEPRRTASWYSPYPLIFQARLSLAEGERAERRQAAQDALELAERSGDPAGAALGVGVIAEVDILEGRAEAARARLIPLLDRPGLEECDVTMLLPVLAWAELELGRPDLADATVEQALGRARPEQMRLVLVEALRVRGGDRAAPGAVGPCGTRP